MVILLVRGSATAPITATASTATVVFGRSGLFSNLTIYLFINSARKRGLKIRRTVYCRTVRMRGAENGLVL